MSDNNCPLRHNSFALATAPNELLLFDLSSGSHRPLQGHACQIQAVECAMDDHAIIFPIALLPCGGIQAVEYAMDGDVILSCGGCTLKVWDSTSALLLHSCGPGVAATATATASGNPSIACHRNKIRALAVNQKMSYLAATSGASGDPQVILWDVRVAKPLAHLSPSFTLPPSWAVGTAGQSAPVRVCMAMDVLCWQHGNLPRCECAWRWMRCASLALHCMSHHPFTPSRAATQSARVRVPMAMDALCFADERWLMCGSDTTGSAPSTIVLWDTSRPTSSSAAPSASPAATATPGASAPSAGPSVFHMPAFSSFVTCVAANPTDSRTVVAGGGDGGVALFDSCTHKAITRFSLGGSFEVRGIRGARGRQVTSAALSPCDRSRCLPSFSSSAAAPPSSSSAPPSSSSCPSPSLRALFCLSHGPPMPLVHTSGVVWCQANPTCSRLCALVVWLEHAESGVRGGRGGGVSASFVDCGDEGVNDARWLSASPGFVTATGNGSVAVWDLKRDLTLANPLTAFSFNWLNDQSCILLTLQPFPCSSAVPSIPPSPQQCGSAAVALASPSLHGRWRGHPVTPALPFEASQKPILCSSSPSLHDQVAVAPDDACIATGGDDQKVVSAFLSPLLHS
ncbi:unnamed protein product [Closterium sp. NIES-64]|nr:unnamed protein product [Closterium sp. NIES-64]